MYGVQNSDLLESNLAPTSLIIVHFLQKIYKKKKFIVAEKKNLRQIYPVCKDPFVIIKIEWETNKSE